MNADKSLLFIPDISGYTQFVQSTETEHSRHVIAELLEVLIEANTQELALAEVEGDALFFYKEGEIPSQEKLLAQIETMFTAFYSHLKMLEKNRICPCTACATAPKLRLKVVAHCGDLGFIEVQGNRKPFGSQVIEAHRLLKNSIDSDNYALISNDLAQNIGLPLHYCSKVFQFESGFDTYDGKNVDYMYALIERENLTLSAYHQAKEVVLDRPPKLTTRKEFPVKASVLFEYITNYTYRSYWVKGVDKFEYQENQVTRAGTEHLCVINGKHLNIIAVTREAAPGELVYGEMTTSLLPFDVFYQFYTIKPVEDGKSMLVTETYWETKSILKKLLIALVVKRAFTKNGTKSLTDLSNFIRQREGLNVES
ncbi:MAG: DUF2652 domain-containing protein [Flavobacteriaceae bacterium]